MKTMLSGPAAGSRAGLAALCLAFAGCAAGPSPSTGPASPSVSPGYQALFRGQSDGPEGRGRFRLALSLLPPDRLRMEFFGPVGGPRLVVVASRDSAIALRPLERIYERTESSARALEDLLGVPLDAQGIVALFTGRPMCAPEAVRVEVMTRPAATFGRTLAWYEVTCPPGEMRYQARCEERGGALLSAVVREGISGAIILEVEYGDYEKGLGPRWPRQIRVRLPRRDVVVELSALEGPWTRSVSEEIVSPEIPEGFRERALGLSPGAQGLLGRENLNRGD